MCVSNPSFLLQKGRKPTSCRRVGVEGVPRADAFSKLLTGLVGFHKNLRTANWRTDHENNLFIAWRLERAFQ